MGCASVDLKKPMADHSFPQEIFSDTDLLAYLDEALPAERASRVEQLARDSVEIRQRLVALLARRDQGGHTLGEIWRRRQLSCPSRSDLAGYLAGRLTGPEREYLEFHLHSIQCPVCQANLLDLQQKNETSGTEGVQRRQRIFESSAGGLRRPD